MKPPKGFKITNRCPTQWVNNRTGRKGYTIGCIYLQCASDLDTGILCKNEIFIVADLGYSVNDISDSLAKDLFEAKGWSVSPTRCPKCQEIHGK